ncbi:hypothetical protein GGI04_001094 [Coemansia thaxteri]|nr:hypothetical protein GGI04_001094 [Coemansia thaxteri]
MEDHINVAIRVRPLNQRELRFAATGGPVAQAPWQVQRDTITQRHYSDGRAVNGNSYTFDKVFDQRDTTQTVYNNIVKEIITSAMSGFNGTIFAYGQTSSGKTHTMYGTGEELGIIKLAVRNMFDVVSNDSSREYLIRVSFLEIYNEVLRDLLEPSKTNLKIHENAKREIFVGDLSEHIVFNAAQVEEILEKGDKNRHIAGTNMNERSSRSHTLFRIVIESREKAEAAAAGDNGALDTRDSDSLAKRHQRLSTGSTADSGEFTGAVMVSCLNLVDLAGSERVGQTGAEGQRLKEGAHINKSLLSLGTVIARLSEDGGDRGHIPYRDSKLTRILQPSLGGNAKTLIICTITPSPDYVEEALSTLKFASRAKTIQNKPEVNEELRGDALLRRLKRASELEKEVAQMREIERKKNKIEADNESLLRQLYRSQKERERLQNELEMQQRNVFLSRATDGRDATDALNAIRRQTWFSGLQRPLGEGEAPASVSVSTVAQQSLGGMAATPMEVDEDVASERPQPRTWSRNGPDSPLRRTSMAKQATDSGPRKKPSQQPSDEPTKRNQEMEETIGGYTRDYSLLLASLGKLATAKEIPPSPAKAAQSPQAPTELVQIRRKLRALMTAIEVSRKQCQEIRSQRPEAEFLEMELQAIRETLVQREEHLANALREAEELRTSQCEAETSRVVAEQTCQSLQSLLIAANGERDAAHKMHAEAHAQLVQERLEFDKRLAEQEAEAECGPGCAAEHQAEIAALLNSHSEALSQRDRVVQECQEREQLLLQERDATHLTASQLKSRAASAERELEQQRTALASARAEASDLKAQISQKAQELEQVRQQMASDSAATVADLQAQISRQGAVNSAQALEIEHKTEQISQFGETVAKLAQQLVDSDAARLSDVERLKSSLSAANDELVGEKQRISMLTLDLEVAQEERLRLAAELLQLNGNGGTVATLLVEQSRLSAELDSARSSSADLAQQLQTSTASLAEVSQACTFAQAKVKTLEDQNADSLGRISKLAAANEMLEATLAAINTTISALNGSADEAKLELAAKATELSDLESALKAAKLAAAAADADAASMKLELNDLQNALALCSEEHQTAKAEFDALTSKHESLCKEKCDAQNEYESKLTELEERLSNNSSQLQRLKHEFAAVKTDRDRLHTLLREQDGEATGHARLLEEQLAATQSRLETLQVEVVQRNEDAKAAAQLNAELSSQLDTISSAAGVLEAQRLEVQDTAQKRILQLQSEIDDSRKEMDESSRRYMAQAAAAEAQSECWLGQIDQMKQDIDTASRTESELREQLHSYAAVKHDLDASILQLQSDLGTARDELQHATATHAAQVLTLQSVISETGKQLGEKLTGAEHAVSAKAEAERLLTSRLNDLRKQYDQVCADLSELGLVRDSLSGEVKRLMAQAERQSVQAADSVKKLQDAQDASMAAVTEIRTRLDAITAERDALVLSAADGSAHFDSATAEATRLQSELDTLREDHKRLSIEHSGVSSCVIDMRAEVESAAAAHEKTLDLLSKQECLAQASAAQLKASQEQLAAALRQVDALTTNNQSMFAERDAQLAEANEKCVVLSRKNAALQQEFETVRASCDCLTKQAEDADSKRLLLADRLAGAETALEQANNVEAQLRHRIGGLEAELDAQRNSMSALQAASESVSEQKAAIERLSTDLDSKSALCEDLSLELEKARAAVCQAQAAEAALHVENEQLRTEHGSLVELAQGRQADMENAIAEAQSELNSRRIEVSGLELALEDANAALAAARVESREAAVANVKSLEAQIEAGEKTIVELQEAITALRASSEQEVSALKESVADEQARLDDAVATINLLVNERDQARQGIATLKSMMTDLAQIKDSEISELEDRLVQCEVLLQASGNESQDKDVLVKQAEELAAENCLRAENAEAELEKALALNAQAVKRLSTERDDASKELASATHSVAALESSIATSKAEIDRLLQEISRRKRAEAEMQQGLDRASESAEQSRLDLLSSVAAELMAIAKNLSALPGCENIAATLSADPDKSLGDTASYHSMLDAIRDISAAAVAHASSCSMDAAGANEAALSQKEVSRLAALTEKLEKKNVKLRDLYTSDMTALHAEEEKQRKRAESLANELADRVKQLGAADGELERVRRDLEVQIKRRAELEAAVERLSTQRTPAKPDNKRPHPMSAADTNPVAANALSPVSSSTLNSRQGQQDDQSHLHPARKRTAAPSPAIPAAAAVRSDSATAGPATKTEAPLARSTYGDRRRMRRNQPVYRADGLEEQAAEQCVQQ